MSHGYLKTVRQLTTQPTSRQRGQRQVTVETSTKNTSISRHTNNNVMTGVFKGVLSAWKTQNNTRTHTDTQLSKPDRCSWERRILRDCFVILFPKCAQRVTEWLSTSSGTRVAKSGLEVGHWFKPVLKVIRLAEQSSHTLPSSTIKMPYQFFYAWTGAGLSIV